MSLRYQLTLGCNVGPLYIFVTLEKNNMQMKSITGADGRHSDNFVVSNYKGAVVLTTSWAANEDNVVTRTTMCL